MEMRQKGIRTLTVLPDKAALDRAAAHLVRSTAARSVASGGRFTLALSGGGTPRAAHRLLAEPSPAPVIPWDRTLVFWVDERCVPPDDPASNYGAALEDLVGRVPLPGKNVFPMPGTEDPERGAAAYAALLSRTLESPEGRAPRFDLILLGIGKDGHTASLFPGDPALEERERTVAPVRGGIPNVPRLTLTLPVLNQASLAVFLVSGRDKAATVKAILEHPEGPLPASRVRGNVTWLLDAEAASALEGPEPMEEATAEGDR